jgi:hypothetical protein
MGRMVRFSLWSEYSAYKDLIGRLPSFSKQSIGLHLAVTPERFLTEGEDLRNLLKFASEMDVEVRLWFLLNHEKGYWLNKWNVEYFLDFVRYCLAELRKDKVPFEWLTFDLEPSPDFQSEKSAYLKNKDQKGLVRFLQMKSEEESLSGAVLKLKNFVEALQLAGFKVHATTHPLVLHDGEDRKLQTALGLPLDGVPWDEVSFMVYRPYFQDLLGPVNARVVYDYARIIKKKFGEKGALDLGPVGKFGEVGTPNHYKKPEMLLDDIAAAKAAGISKVHVFSAEGVESEGGVERWITKSGKTKPWMDWRLPAYYYFIRRVKSRLPKAL